MLHWKFKLHFKWDRCYALLFTFAHSNFMRCHFAGWKEMIIIQNVALYMYSLRLHKNFSQLTFLLLPKIHLYFLLSFLMLRFQYRPHEWFLIIIATMIGLRKLSCTLKDYNEPVFLIHHFARALVCAFFHKKPIAWGEGERVLPCISYIGMCHPKGYGFWAVLVCKWV